MNKYFKTFIYGMIFSISALGSTHKLNSTIRIVRVNYGKSYLGKKLVGYKVFNPSYKGKRIAALMTGGIHGNEYMEVVEKFIEVVQDQEFAGNKFFQNGGVLFIVPKINPDGVRIKNRYSVKGEDLNRDFNLDSKDSFLKSQESYYLVNWLDREVKKNQSQLIFAVDYHCCANALIHPKYDEKFQAPIYQDLYSKVSSLLKSNFKREFKIGETKDVFGNTTIGTLKDYWHKVYGTVSFTFEGDLPHTEKNHMGEHISWWKNVLSSLTDLAPKELASLSTQNPAQYAEVFSNTRFKPYSE